MTTIDKLHLPTRKSHTGAVKCERAASILSKWESRLTQLQKGKPQATENRPQGDKLPLRKLEIVAENSAATVSINRQAAALQRAITKAKAPKNKPPKKR
jgi:hypothetical protein